MLQTACVSPELLVNPTISNNEACGYGPSQGSPLPGETASPKSYFQQSPSLPASGLTELSAVSPKIYPPPSHKPQEMSAPADSGLSSGAPQRRYMGVRVKMPVRELLRKVRLSKGLEPAASKEASLMKMVTKGSSGKTEKRRVHPYTENQLRQGKQSAGQTPRGLEDLDMLVEVLQEDLNKSQLKEEPPHSLPGGAWQGSPWGAGGSRQGAGSLQERCPSPARPCPCCCADSSASASRGAAETSREQKARRESSSPGVWWRPSRSCWSQKGFPGQSPEDTDPHWNPPGGCSEVLPAAGTACPDTGGRPKAPPVSFSQQDLSAISFFQFQLHREESFLRDIPAEKLLAPDENGNRLLHQAVAQGRRALAYALARRFAALRRINEKDAEKRTALHIAAERNQHLMVSDLISLGANVNEQDSLGKTPLHLCAENGYLRVLEVLKNCKSSGMCVEVNLTDHYGLTALQRAALAHALLATQSQSPALDPALGRLLSLRQQQVLEGIHCLLQMGGEPEAQVLNPGQVATGWSRLEENTELTWLLQTYWAEGQSAQESCNVLDAQRMPGPSALDSFSELSSMSSSGL